MPEAAIYARISDDRIGDAAGVKRQEGDCRALCDKRGWNVAEVYVDNSVSAWAARRRPEYRRMMDDARAGRIDVIVVWHLDRLYRHPLELEELIDLAEAGRVQVVTVTGGDYDLTTSDGRAMARVIVAFARKESDDKSRRTKRKHLELAQAGAIVGSGKPYGWEVDRRTVNPVEAAVVRDCADRVLAGESLWGVCRSLNEGGIPPPKAAVWRPTRLNGILLNGRIAGLRTFDGEVMATGQWEPIVDETTWRSLCAVLGRGSNGHPGNQFPARRYLLPGLLYCGRCGTKLVSRPKVKDRRYYCCSSGPQDEGCGGIGVVAEPVEALVTARALDRLDSPQLAQALGRRRQDRAPAGAMVAMVAIGQIEARMSELADMFAAGEIGRAEWLRSRTGLEGRLERARKLLRQDQAQAAAWANVGRGVAIGEAWPEMSLEQKRVVLRSVIDRIDVGPANAKPGIWRFDPDRVSIVWRW